MKIAAWTAGMMLGLAAAAPAAVEGDTVAGLFDSTDFSLTTGMISSFEAGIFGTVVPDGGGLWAD